MECPRVQAAPEILKGKDKRVLSLTPRRGARLEVPGRAKGSCQRPPSPNHLPSASGPSPGFTESSPQALLAHEPRPGLNRAFLQQCQPLGPRGARAPVHAARRPELRRGFVFAGMRGCFVSPRGTRETRAACCPPARAAAPASGPLPGLRPRALAFVRHISIKLPRISRLNNSTQKESA